MFTATVASQPWRWKGFAEIRQEQGGEQQHPTRRDPFSSHDASGAFEVAVCAAMSDELLDTELFGATKGAYTGSDRDRAGIFSRADGGTVTSTG